MYNTRHGPLPAPKLKEVFVRALLLSSEGEVQKGFKIWGSESSHFLKHDLPRFLLPAATRTSVLPPAFIHAILAQSLFTFCSHLPVPLGSAWPLHCAVSERSWMSPLPLSLTLSGPGWGLPPCSVPGQLINPSQKSP